MNKTILYPLASKCVCLSLVFNIIACKPQNNKQEDSKDIATKFNDAKFSSSKEAKFLVDATEICYEEIELARLAQSNGSNENIKEIAKMMEKDHTAMLDEIKKIAETKDITIPSEITASGQKERKKQATKSGVEFDKQYCETVVDNHKKAIKKYMSAMEDCEDIDVKNFANKTLVTLRNHIDHAMSCSEAYKETKNDPGKTLDNNMKEAKEHPAAKTHTTTHSDPNADSKTGDSKSQKEKQKEKESDKDKANNVRK